MWEVRERKGAVGAESQRRHAAHGESRVVALRPRLHPLHGLSLIHISGNGFPQWKDNLFVGALQVGRIPGTGHVQRKRDVKQGPDGLLYVLTEGPEAALPKVEPAGG